MSEQTKFKVGDIVTCAWLKGEHVLVEGTTEKYPLKIEKDCSTFDHNGFYDDTHELPVLTLVKSKKEPMTFERIKKEGIKKLKNNCSVRHVIGFDPEKGNLVTTLMPGGGSGTWSEGEIKDWEAVE